MKNPFIKEDNTALWIAAAATGALAAAAGIWFYLHGKRTAGLETDRLAHVRNYLHAKRKKKQKHKTDPHELGEIVHHQQA